VRRALTGSRRKTVNHLVAGVDTALDAAQAN
jgi:hypothetical protein